jgi:hypothetical protein
VPPSTFGNSSSLSNVIVGQYNYDFLAAVAIDSPLAIRNRCDACSNSDENSVAHRVPVRVVNVLEAIDVDK